MVVARTDTCRGFNWKADMRREVEEEISLGVKSDQHRESSENRTRARVSRIYWTSTVIRSILYSPSTDYGLRITEQEIKSSKFDFRLKVKMPRTQLHRAASYSYEITRRNE